MKICPLKFGKVVSLDERCVMQECAWWDSFYKRCAMSTIATASAILVNKITKQE
jgi:hypothetical protein